MRLEQGEHSPEPAGEPAGSSNPVLVERLRVAIGSASSAREKLVLLVGHRGAGKTRLLRLLSADYGVPLVNLSGALSQRLLELSAQRMALRAHRELADLIDGTEGDVVLLDCIELLFLPELKLEPLRALQSISRNRPVVAAWRGKYASGTIEYAEAGHPEHYRSEELDAVVVTVSDESGAWPDRPAEIE